MTAAKPNPIPDTYRRITPCLVVHGAAKALEFYAQVFGATERMRFPGPNGTIGHAEIVIGDSVVIVEDEDPQRGTTAPPAGGLPGSPVFQFIYVDDVDAVVARAVEAGAALLRAPQDQFYGDRDGHIVDPFGHGWVVASHVEDLTPEEMGQRLAALYGEDER
ncbi:VOC family protein [Phytohabitans aurantiacus]|jgi:PhnB protein|uniref:Glyoxalase n=1 Tax=Phytohabitans aurantiacus TaxID=3016789 RepID=A0ABQ5R999_9ACTN|nr:VOC family protein [Phytohabitans aurantiacus]GLI02722.1 glyoxalase [Phytohabitans aurantiacus]